MTTLLLLNDFDTSNPLFVFLCAIIVLIVLFFILRGFLLWYWKIPVQIENQKEIIRLLRLISGKESPDLKICPHCKKSIANAIETCPHCGEKFK